MEKEYKIFITSLYLIYLMYLLNKWSLKIDLKNQLISENNLYERKCLKDLS